MNHSIDKMKSSVYGKYLPAANEGDPLAAKECGKYFSLIEDYDNAIKYFEHYLTAFPNDMNIKIKLKYLRIKQIKRIF